MARSSNSSGYFLALGMFGDFSSRQANPGIEVSVKPRMAQCELLCVSTPITIIRFVLSLDATFGRTSGGQTSVGAKPRSYQVTPEILGRWRATQLS